MQNSDIHVDNIIGIGESHTMSQMEYDKKKKLYHTHFFLDKMLQLLESMSSRSDFVFLFFLYSSSMKNLTSGVAKLNVKK